MDFEPDLEPDRSRVEVSRFYRCSPENVWQALTEPALIERWLMPSTGFVGAVLGTHFLLSVHPSSPSAEIACEVVDVTLPGSMTWSWMDLRASPPAHWFVRWDVYAHGRGSRLVVTHTGFDVDDKRQMMARNAFTRGWDQVLSGKLAEVLEAN
ncbi:SRPBCC family protein [Rhodococcus sp. IEGM1428]|uniref:SRPBCC family protein n=1 Tax=Rhodococcus sp. IEGM1428 TaxID=3392191 RepID=UPI003D118F60